MAKAPVYSIAQKDIAVHIGEQTFQSWVTVDGVGIRASKIEVVSDPSTTYSKLVVEIPMLCVEVVA